MSIEVWSLIIAAAGVAVTGFFSYQIFKANERSAEAAEGATKAAMESAKISKYMLEMQETQKSEMRKQTIREVLSQIMWIQAYTKVILKAEVYSEPMKKMPERINITGNEIASYFNNEEQILLNKILNVYKRYRLDYFKDGLPNFSLDEQYLEANQKLYDLSTELINKLGAFA